MNVVGLLQDVLTDGEAWMEHAVCPQTDPEIFFPTHGGNTAARQAKRVCSQCPVRARHLGGTGECVDYAIRHGEPGIWGGLSERERRRVARGEDLTARVKGRWAHTQPCGTEAAYQRHLRYGEQPCRACVAARLEMVHARKARKASHEG